MKEKFLWIGLSLIMLSWIGNSVYFQSKQIEEPIFLDHYYSFHMNERETRLRFFFLADKNDQRRINYATIDGIEIYPDDIFNSRDIPYIKEFTHQNLRSISFLIDDYVLEQRNSDEPWTIEKMSFTFSDGETVEADIGKIELLPFSKEKIVLNPHHTYGNSLIPYRSETTISPTSDVTIDHVKIPFSEMMGDQMEIKMTDALELNEVEFFGLDWSEVPGEKLEELSLPKSLYKKEEYNILSHVSPDFPAFIKMEILFEGRTENEEPFSSYQLIESEPILNEQIIQQVIDTKDGDSK